MNFASLKMHGVEGLQMVVECPSPKGTSYIYCCVFLKFGLGFQAPSVLPMYFELWFIILIYTASCEYEIVLDS